MQVLVPPEVRSRQAARFNHGPAAPAASTAPKLRDRLREQIRLEGKSPNTAAVYWHWTKGYIRFHGLQHPQDLGVDDHGYFRRLSSPITASFALLDRLEPIQ